MNVKKIVYVIIFAGIIFYFLPDNITKKCFNCVIICFICISLLNSLSNLRFSFGSFDISDSINNYKNHAENYNYQYNIFFDNIKEKEFVNEEQN